MAILDNKIDAIEKAGVRAIVSSDASCLMQIGGRLSRNGSQSSRCTWLNSWPREKTYSRLSSLLMFLKVARASCACNHGQDARATS